MNAWHSLDYDTRKFYDRGEHQDDFEAEIAKFISNVPLSPSVPEEDSDRSDDYFSDDELMTISQEERRAIQQWNRYRRDYKRREANDAAPSLGQPFPFRKLPFDVRRMFYVLLVKQIGPVTQLEPNGTGRHTSGPIDLRIAFTSKQLFTEVMKVFFEINTIDVHIHPSSTIGLPILCNPKAVSAPYWPLENIKRINLYVSYHQTEHGNFVAAELKKFCNFFQNCSLTYMQITAFCGKSWFNEDLRKSFDKPLLCLEPLRGVQKVVFTEDLDGCGKSNVFISNYHCHNIGTADCRKRLQQAMTEPRETMTKG